MTPITLACLPLMLIVGLSACAERNPDEELQRFVEATAEATGERDTGYFRGIIADSYIDFRGNDRDRAIELIRGFFLLNSQIEADARIIDVEWNGTESARMTVAAKLDGNLRSVSPQLELELLRDGSDWSVIGARWEEDSRSRPW